MSAETVTSHHTVETRTMQSSGSPTMYTSTGHLISSVEGEHHCIGLSGAKLFASVTEREKKEMQELNDRLSNYIARVKLLEDQNRALVASLTDLRSKWGSKNSQYKSQYSETITTSRKDVDTSARARAAVEVRASRLRDDIAEYRSRYEEVLRLKESDRNRIPQWTVAIKEAETELSMIKARFEHVQSEERAVLAENARIWADLHGVRETLDAETTARIDFQGQVQSIMAEIQFLKKVHESEVRELNSLLIVAPADTKEFFRNELALAVRDIKKEYELIANRSRVEVERWYKTKVTEVQASVGRKAESNEYMSESMSRMSGNMSELRSKYSELESRNVTLEKEVSSLQFQVSDDQRQYESALSQRDATLISVRTECHKLVAELQSLLDTKQMLDAEISIYRAMLEGEEKRVGVVKMQTASMVEEHADQWEVATRTKFQTQAHGNLAIVQCEPTGRFLVIENTSRTQEENLSGWRINRVIDGSRELNYTFPQGAYLSPASKLKILARDQGAVAPGILMFEGEMSWGMGTVVVTTLFNAHGQERAVYTQRTVTSPV